MDACDIDMTEDPVADEDIDALVLFADCETGDEVQQRQQEWQDLFNGS